MKQTKKQTQKEQKMTSAKKVKLNVNYVDFISKVITEKLQTMETPKLRKIYTQTVKVKSYSNIKRVDTRVKRERLKSLLAKELKSRNINLKDFNTVSQQIVTKIAARGKGTNYKEI